MEYSKLFISFYNTKAIKYGDNIKLYIVASLSQFSVSYINGIRYKFLTVIILRAQQSIQRRKPLLGFLIKITNIAIGEVLTLVNLLLKLLSEYFYSIQSLFWNILYRGLNLSCFSSLNIILQLYNQYSSSLLASFYKTASRRLQYSTSTFIIGLVCFFSTKAFLISAIVIVKIIYLGFLASRATRVALIIQISRALSRL